MLHSPGKDKRQAVALVIVLAFIVLVTGLIIAFFSRAVLDHQISNSSASQVKVAMFAQGAMDQIAADLKQEIVDSSSNTGINIVITGTSPTTLYYPLSNATMTPYRPGTNGGPNVVTTSGTGPLYPLASGTYNNAGPNRASTALTTGTSINGRYMTPARWNKPLLFGTNSFTAPNWILVARDGSNPGTSGTFSNSIVYSSTDTAAVIGRYAYVIYDEGGLLDVNAAGYPSTTGTAQSACKNALAYADLTQLGLSGTAIDAIVGWRNYASTNAPGAFPSPNFTAASGSNYYNFVLSNTTGFLTVSGSTYNNQSDTVFTSRQQLIQFLTQGLGLSGSSLDALQYLGTFSRDINQPSYIPAVQTSGTAPVVLAANLGGNSALGGDKLINPSFLNVQVQASFTRNDGSTAVVSQPLVNKRFALNRLAWITYKGPSASRTQTDPDIQALINDGIPWSYLQLGTAANIQKYFGLNWDSQNNRWNYNYEVGTSGINNIIMLVGRPAGTAANATKYVEDANRDPNFFELLKAGITVGSLGKAGLPSGSTVSSSQTAGGYSTAQVPVNLRYAFDTSVDYHVIQLGANILSEVNPASYPVRITFNDGSSRGAWEFQGVTDLPYLNYVFNGVLRTQLPNPGPPASWADTSPFQYPSAVIGTLATSGTAYMVQVPGVWNPYDPNGTPGVLRPSQFRILIDSNDPVTLSGTNGLSETSGANDLPMWHAAEGSSSGGSNVGGGSNQGLIFNSPFYSTWCSGTGGTTERWSGSAGPGIGTPVTDAVTFTDGTGAFYREPTLIFSTTAPGNATRVNAMASGTGANITGVDANPLPGESDGSTGPWAPLVLGQFPLAFANSPTSGNSTTTVYYAGIGAIGNAAYYTTGSPDNRIYLTYRLQYADPINTGKWVTYDTKYGRTTDGLFSYQSRNGSSPCVMTGANEGFDTYSWASAIDPRTGRFGLFTDTMNPQRSSAPGAPTGWIFNSGSATTSGSTTVGITYPIRQDNSVGFYFVNLDMGNVPNGGQTGGNSAALLSQWLSPTSDIPYTSWFAGWTAPVCTTHVNSDIWMFAPGMYAQNSPGAPFLKGSTIEPSYYADADGIVRRAAGAYVASGGTAAGIAATSPVGLPPASIQGYTGAVSSLVTPAGATPFTQSQSRPLLLHRPFLTVAELGYVFRDLPWKDLDFFTPESGDAALLDLFCINDTSDPSGIVAGKVNLNTRQAPVLQAIVSGAYVDNPKITDATVGSVSPSLSGTVSSALVARTSGTNYGPLENLSELVGKWNAAVAASGTASGFIYKPTNVANSWGSDLLLPNYADGRLSYVGFSGASSVSGTSGTVDNLSDAYANASYSNASLQTSMSQVKRFREAPIRALASAGQTRVWNLMIDVIAQTGRYPQSAASLDNFVVEGEHRCWLHVAIDRFTGQIIDKQLEIVKE